MTKNEMIKKIEELQELETFIEEIKAEAETIKDSIKPELFTPVPDNRLNTEKTQIKMKNGLSPKR